MVGILQFWVCAVVHVEAISKLIIERDIERLGNINDVTCQDFEESTSFELRLTFYIKTNE